MTQMNRKIEDAWILLSDAQTNSMIWRKFSELKPVVIRKRNCTIGYLDHCYGLDLDCICDPKTFEIAVMDVIQLNAHTPFELFEELNKRNLLVFDDEVHCSITSSSAEKNISSQTTIGSFDGSEFNVKMPDVSFPLYEMSSSFN